MLGKYLVITPKKSKLKNHLEIFACPNRRFLGNYLSTRQVGRVLAKSLTATKCIQLFITIDQLFFQQNVFKCCVLICGEKMITFCSHATYIMGRNATGISNCVTVTLTLESPEMVG